MRPPRESLLLLGLLTGVCLFAGMVAGISTGIFVAPPLATPTAVPAPTNTMAPLPAAAVSLEPGTQKSLLLLGVTEAGAPASPLEVCWVVTFVAGAPEYYVVAFPPSASLYVPSLQGANTLSKIHAEDMRLQLDHNFVRDAVQTRFSGLTIQATVTLDRGDVSALVTELGGLPVENQVLLGPALLQVYDGWPAASELDRLQYQHQLLRQLFALVAQRNWTPGDLVDHLSALPGLSDDPSMLSALRAFAQGAPPLNPDSLIWHAYGPELEAASAPADHTP